MKRSLLIELLKLIEAKDLSEEIKELSEKQNLKGYEILLKLTDKQIEIILKQTYPEIVYALIYIYTNYERIPEKIKELLNEAIEKQNSNLTYMPDMLGFNKLMVREDAYDFFKVALDANGIVIEHVVIASTCRKLLNREDAIEFVKKVSQSRGLYYAQYVCEVATDKNILKKENALEYVDAVLRAVSVDNSQCASKVACNVEALKREDSLEIVKLLAGLQNHLEFVYKSVCNMVNRDKSIDVLAFAKKIAEAKDKYRASYVSSAIIESNIFQREDAMDFIDLIVHAKELFHAQYASLCVQNSMLLTKENALDIVKAVSMANGQYQTQYASSIARNYDLLRIKENILDFVTVIAQAETTDQASDVYLAAKDKVIMIREDALGIVKAIANAKSPLNANYAYEVAKNDILQNSVNLLQVVKLIASANEEHQIKGASNIAVLPWVIEREDYLQLVAAVANSIGESQTCLATYELNKENSTASLEDILKITNSDMAQELKRPNDLSLQEVLQLISTLTSNGNFISQRAVSLLASGNIGQIVAMLSNCDSEEIEPNTVVKVKIHEKNI